MLEKQIFNISIYLLVLVVFLFMIHSCRKLNFVLQVGDKSLPEDEEIELNSLITEMGKVYGEAKVCIDGNENGEQCYNLEPELTDIMAESHNFTLRTYIWQV